MSEWREMTPREVRRVNRRERVRDLFRWRQRRRAARWLVQRGHMIEDYGFPADRYTLRLRKRARRSTS